jgi:hypothetical protein
MAVVEQLLWDKGNLSGTGAGQREAADQARFIDELAKVLRLQVRQAMTKVKDRRSRRSGCSATWT